ncbi:MAG: lysylphosphatidylglycerol synthase transmembrane domain-containing protein [Bacteroidota bacterium]
MEKKIKIFLSLIGFIVLAFLINEYGITNIILNIQKTGWWLFTIIGTWLFVYILNSIAFYLILISGNNRFSFIKIFSISISGFAVNYITPGINLGGEPYKIWTLKNKIGLHSAIASVILYTMLHFLSSFIFWIVGVIFIPFAIKISYQLKILSLFVLSISIIGILFFLSRHKKGVIQWFILFIRKIPYSQKIINKLEIKDETPAKIDEQIVNLYKNQKIYFYSSLTLEVISRIVASLEFLFILWSIGIDISFAEAILINAFSSLLINIFFFMPMTLGIREGSLVFIMDLLKYSSGTGVYVGLINRLRELFWILVGLLIMQFNNHKSISDTN